MRVRTARHLPRIGAVAFVVAIAGAAAIAFWRARSHDPILAALSEAIRESQSIELHEGTRPRRLDRDPDSRTLQGASAVQTVGYDELYREPTKWHEGDAQALSALLSDTSTFAPLRPKGCMGFHTDFAVEWKAKGKSCFVMICFGCAELRVVTPDSLQVYDQSPNARWDLLRILRAYREHRPPDDSEFWRDLNPDGTMVCPSESYSEQLDSLRGVARWGIPQPN